MGNTDAEVIPNGDSVHQNGKVKQNGNVENFKNVVSSNSFIIIDYFLSVLLIICLATLNFIISLK